MLILAHLRLPAGVTRLGRCSTTTTPTCGSWRSPAFLAEDPDAVPRSCGPCPKRRLAPERVIEQLGQPWAVESLLAQLRAELDARGEQRRASASCPCSAMGDPRPAMIELLGKGLSRSGSRRRARSARSACAARGRARRALHDEAWPLRARAAKALGTIGIKRSVPALEAVLDDPAWWVRANAATALRALPRPGARRAGAGAGPSRYALRPGAGGLAMDRVGVGG